LTPLKIASVGRARGSFRYVWFVNDKTDVPPSDGQAATSSLGVAVDEEELDAALVEPSVVDVPVVVVEASSVAVAVAVAVAVVVPVPVAVADS
jgi:hypothetical protein